MIRLALVSALCPLTFTLCLAANLAPDAAYSVIIAGFAYHGQVIPGTNLPATAQGFVDAPPWQGPAYALTDGRRDGDAVTSWFWSHMDKRIRVLLDLRRPARVTAVRLWPQAGGNTTFDRAVLRIAADEAGLATAPELPLQPADGGMAWSGPAREGRFLLVLCFSSAPTISLSEVEVEGEPLGDILRDAPAPGLIPVKPRDLAPLIRLPDMPPDTTNITLPAPPASRWPSPRATMMTGWARGQTTSAPCKVTPQAKH